MNRRWLLCGLASLMAIATLPAMAGNIHIDLQEVLASATPDQTVSTLVFLGDQLDVEALSAGLDSRRATRQERHETVVRGLQDQARTTQGDLLSYLKGLELTGRAELVQPFWISNVIRVDAPAREIGLLADHPSIGTIYLNYEIELIQPVGETVPANDPRDAPEIGLVAINAPDVWGMGITGAGVLVANMDTGVDGHHESLASRWAGVADPRYAGHPEWAWYDPYAGQNDFPYDNNGHGTHTMGTICGGAPGDEIGVAPGAIWMASGPIDRGGGIPTTVANALLSFEWMLDPDGNPNTDWDVPRVCSNSWGLTTGHGYPPCDELFWNHLDNCEAAGTLIIFSAGNEGSSGLRRPSDRATDDYRTMAVAAVDAGVAGWPIAGFSSRGPTYCTPNSTAAIKPDIAAPGVDVRSARNGGGYRELDGTSMASPHINGVVALMMEACPDLTIEEYKQIVYDTAYDLGSPGEDNDYGWGMVDAHAAVLMTLDMCGPHPPRVDDGFFATALNTPVAVELDARDDGLPDPPGRMTFIIVTLPEHGRLTDPNAGPIETVPYTLANYGNEATYIPNFFYNGMDEFTWKANDGGVPPEGGDSDIATMTGMMGGPELFQSFPLDSDPGWTTEDLWAFGTPTGQGGQYGGPDPTSGHTGGYVYGYNLNGDYSNSIPEYDLTTTAIDCTGATQVSLKFWRWLGVERSQYDHAYIRVSNDGSTWNTVWANPDTETADTAWTRQEVDISAFADEQPTVYLRWTMGSTDTGWVYCGWNIDDVELWGMVEHTEGIILPDDFTLVRGQVEAGVLDDLFSSDDSRLVARAGPTMGVQEPPVWMRLEGTSPLAAPDELRFRFEGGAVTPGMFRQKIEMYDHVAGIWEELDSRPASQGDSSVEIVISDHASRFIEPGTMVISAQLTWMPTGPSLAFPWKIGIDQAVWAIPVQPKDSPLVGDVNCDGRVDFGDITPFVKLLCDRTAWQADYPGCPASSGDANRDGRVDFGDINPLVELLSR